MLIASPIDERRATPRAERRACACRATHAPRLVVLTGGPGAGKTAVLEVVQRHFCRHVVVLPEAAGMLFGGGFPRTTSEVARKSAQRAIFHVQRELERVALDEPAAVILCDRGTLDGAAYWPGTMDEFLKDVGTTLEHEIERYASVIHLRTPSAHNGYDHSNPLRIESALQALAIDERIAGVWGTHPHRITIPATDDFIAKASVAIAAISREVPDCCSGALAHDVRVHE